MKITVTEAIVLLVIMTIGVGLIITFYTNPLSSAFSNGNNAACKANLSSLGKEMIQDSFNYDFFPCSIKLGDSMEVKQEKSQNRNRSTIQTFQDFFEDYKDIEPIRFACPLASKRKSKNDTKLTAQNIGYHYTNGDTNIKVMKGNKGLVRDFNIGHSESEVGNVLAAAGNIREIKQLNKFDKWYRNADDFENFQEFDFWDINNNYPENAD